MITNLKNYDQVKVNYFGEKVDMDVFCTGDSKYEGDHFENVEYDLNEKELEVLNWFLDNVKIEDYRQEIADYCNDVYSMWCDKEIGPEDVENEITISQIAINVTEHWKSKPDVNGHEYVYPEISFYGGCECDVEHGICIGFRDKKFLGIDGQDWTL